MKQEAHWPMGSSPAYYYVPSIVTYFMVKFYLGNVAAFAEVYNLKVYPAAIPFLFTDSGFSCLSMWVLVFLMSAFPIINHLQQNVLLRSGNRIWSNGQMLTMLTMAGLWIVEVQIFVCLAFRNTLDFGSGWGKLWGTAASGKIYDYGYSFSSVSMDVILEYTPTQAVLISMLFILLMAVIFGQIIFCLDGICKNYVGELILSLWTLMWYLTNKFHVLQDSFLIKTFSPKNWLDISRYAGHTERLFQSLGWMIGLIVLLYVVNRVLVHCKIITLK